MDTKKDNVVTFITCFACRLGMCSRGPSCRHKARDKREEKLKVGLHNHQGCTCYRRYNFSPVVEKKAPVVLGNVDLVDAAGPAQWEFLSGDWTAQPETPEHVNKPTIDELAKVIRPDPYSSVCWVHRGKALTAAYADINTNVKRASDRFKVITNGLRQQLKNKEEECKRLAEGNKTLREERDSAQNRVRVVLVENEAQRKLVRELRDDNVCPHPHNQRKLVRYEQDCVFAVCGRCNASLVEKARAVGTAELLHARLTEGLAHVPSCGEVFAELLRVRADNKALEKEVERLKKENDALQACKQEKVTWACSTCGWTTHLIGIPPRGGSCAQCGGTLERLTCLCPCHRLDSGIMHFVPCCDKAQQRK